jgi:3-phenylpropionate/trans-cinnamate dioxygenase ferredoxin reductase component
MAQRADFLIVGGGLAGVSAAETIRALGVRGSVTLVSGETDLPHDRPPLSKEFLRDERSRENVLLHPPDFYRANHVGLLLGRPALALNLDARELLLADGEAVRYRRLLLATGGRPRKLGVPGETMPGIFELRTLAEAEQLKQAASLAERPVVVGAGFIGLEVAASLTARGRPVTVLNLDDQIWPGVMPPAAAAVVQGELEARGLRFRHRTRVAGFEGKERLEVVCTNAGNVDADMAVVGAGLRLNTELAAAAGLAVDGGIVVDSYLQTSCPNVYAAGDVASFPNPLGIAAPPDATAHSGAAAQPGVHPPETAAASAAADDPGARRHVEHWDNAVAQGRVAGANMAGRRVQFRHVPYFWSDLFDLTINVVGLLDGADETLLRGDPADRRFTVLALRGGALRGALMVNRARDRRPLTELVARQTPIAPHRDALADPAFNPTRLLDSVATP